MRFSHTFTIRSWVRIRRKTALHSQTGMSRNDLAHVLKNARVRNQVDGVRRSQLELFLDALNRKGVVGRMPTNKRRAPQCPSSRRRTVQAGCLVNYEANYQAGYSEGMWTRCSAVDLYGTFDEAVWIFDACAKSAICQREEARASCD